MQLSHFLWELKLSILSHVEKAVTLSYFSSSLNELHLEIWRESACCGEKTKGPGVYQQVLMPSRQPENIRRRKIPCLITASHCVQTGDSLNPLYQPDRNKCFTHIHICSYTVNTHGKQAPHNSSSEVQKERTDLITWTQETKTESRIWFLFVLCGWDSTQGAGRVL